MKYHLDRDTLLMVGVHALPLLGVWFVGWSAPALLILYWLETLVIGVGTVVMVALARDQPIALLSSPAHPARTGIGMALFVLAHAGIFMGIHLFMLTMAFELTPGSAPSVLESLPALLFEKGLWLPVVGICMIRALVTMRALQRRESIDRYLIGFYFRIVVMQLAVIGGGFLLVFTGAQGALVVLVAARLAFEFAVPSVEDYVEEHIARLHRRSTGGTGG
ncbi:MAG: hypothetical protein IPK28_20655 [Devosia sp.]|nr:hypothetical protein [Devosia sp.]